MRKGAIEYLATLIESVLLTEAGEVVTTYGVEIAIGGNVERILDISADKGLVEGIVDRCQKFRVSAAHVRDVAEDMLVLREFEA